MSDQRTAKFEWGQRVRAAADLFNDGSFPEQPADALLVKAGEPGEIVQVGAHVETETPIYLVEFGEHKVIGCFAEEIAPV
ncbi:MAG: nitrogen fixation protein NifZ [Methylocella sp.]